MATINANIVNLGIGTLPTDKGKLDYTIVYIDQPINIGDSVNLINRMDFLNIPFPRPYHFFQGVNESSYVINTPFNCDNKIIYRLNLERNEWWFYVYDFNNTLLSSASMSHSSVVNSGKSLGVLYVGTNNTVVWDPFVVMYYTYNIGTEYEIVMNTTEVFGTYFETSRYSLTFPTNSFLVLELNVKRGEVLYALSSIEKVNPYKPGGYSKPDGGNGDFDNTSDPIPVPNLPSISGLSSGMLNAYVPTGSQLQDLANYMWSSSFDLDALKKIFANPIDCILGMSIVPCPITASNASLFVGGIDTGLTMPKTTQQYVEVDCGSKNLKEYWGNFLDYDPYTKIEIYLPFIGTHALNADDVMGHVVGVKYHIDILTGACIAYVTRDDDVIYSFIGQCAISVPITGNDWTNVLNGALNIAGSVGTMVAVGEISAPLAVATAGSVASAGVESNKQNIEKSGSLSGAGGLMGVLTPYLIITRPRQCVPVDQEKYTGYASNITERLGNLNGFTVISDIRLNNIPGTDTEVEELLSILKEGVIL